MLQHSSHPDSTARLPDPVRKDLIHTWDNWYVRIPYTDRQRLISEISAARPEAELLSDARVPLFAVGYLNAPRCYFDGSEGPNQHHFHSRFGVQLTHDFRKFLVLNDEALTALPEESSIWSGSLACGPLLFPPEERRRQYLLFYTSRRPDSPDGMTQEVRLAWTENFLRFQRTACVLQADSRFYETGTIPGDPTVHGFRDPFPFRVGNRAFLLINAKSRFIPAGKAGDTAGSNGVVAIYKGRHDFRLDAWEATSLCFNVGKPEADCPSLYYDETSGEHLLIFSCQSERDYLRRKVGPTGAIEGSTDEQGETWEARIPNLERLLREPPLAPVRLETRKIEAAAKTSYANRIVPELGGLLLGFDTRDGEPCLSGNSGQGGIKAVCSDFSDFIALA